MASVESRVGTVSAVGHGEITVRIQQMSACTGCHAREFCCSTDCAERFIVIPTSDTSYRIDDSVVIEGEHRIGRLAVVLSFVLPIVLLVVGVGASTLYLGLDEAMAALVAIGFLGLYYLVLYALNPRLGRMMQFRVKKADIS